MYFLSIESSSKHFAIAISKDDKVIRFRNYATSNVLEDAIIKHLDKILLAAKLKLNHIDAFAIGLGPGSFTSLRVGLSTVKAFAMALNKPIVGISSLEMIAQAVADEDCDQICVLIDARRKMVYSVIYQKTANGLKQQGKYQLSDIGVVLDQVKGCTLFVGDGLSLYRQDIEAAYKKSNNSCQALFANEQQGRPDIRQLAHLAWKRLQASRTDDLGKILPIYLYPSDCQVSK